MTSTSNQDPQTYAIIGACMDVHNGLGSGFLEAVYQEALSRELVDRRIPFSEQVELVITYKGKPLACRYKADFICYNKIIVEIKAIKQLSALERAQVINYLKATGYSKALLINFGAGSLEYERIIL